jgi:hypothetical protein
MTATSTISTAARRSDLFNGRPATSSIEAKAAAAGLEPAAYEALASAVEAELHAGRTERARRLAVAVLWGTVAAAGLALAAADHLRTGRRAHRG